MTEPPASPTEEQPPPRQTQYDDVQHDHAVVLALLIFARGLSADLTAGR